MIVDVHTHTPAYKDEIPEELIRYDTVWRPDRPVKVPTNWQDYLEATKPADKALVFSLARRERRRHDPMNVNDDTAEFVRAHPDKLIGFLSVHPEEPDCLEEIERSVSDLGLRGIKLGPNYQNFDPLGEAAFRVFKRAEELGLPPRLLRYRFDIYECLFKLNDYEGLLARTLVEIDEGARVEEIHLYRAQTYTALNDSAQARAEYERALEIHPEWKPAEDGLTALSQ